MRQSLRIQLLSLDPSRRHDFQQRREWFILTGYDLLPSFARRRCHQYRRKRIQEDRNHLDDNESVSTTVETYQGLASCPILLEDLRVIASTRRIQIGDESYSIDSCFGFTPSEIVATARGDPESFLNRYSSPPISKTN